MTKVTRITTHTAILEIDLNNIIVITALPNIHATHAHAIENLKAMEKLAQGRPFLLLVDLRESISQDREARHAYANYPVQPRALAFMVDSPMSRMTGNLFVTMKRPIFPSRLFTDLDSAMTWLKKQLVLLQPTAS
jgi:hypothetical protein